MTGKVTIMEIQTLVTQGQKEVLPLEQLRGLATNSHAFGQDVVDVFAGQAERRAAAAQALLTAAEGEQRDLLARWEPPLRARDARSHRAAAAAS